MPSGGAEKGVIGSRNHDVEQEKGRMMADCSPIAVGSVGGGCLLPVSIVLFHGSRHVIDEKGNEAAMGNFDCPQSSRLEPSSIARLSQNEPCSGIYH